MILKNLFLQINDYINITGSSCDSLFWKISIRMSYQRHKAERKKNTLKRNKERNEKARTRQYCHELETEKDILRSSKSRLPKLTKTFLPNLKTVNIPEESDSSIFFSESEDERVYKRTKSSNIRSTILSKK